MATFNIDFNQFKPSSRGGMAMPSSTSSPAPMPKPQMPALKMPSTPQTPTPTSKGKIFTGSLLRKVLDVPMSLGYGISGFQKGAWESLDKQRATGQPINRGLQFKDAIKGAITGVQNRADFGSQPEDINTASRLGIKNPTAQAATNLGLSLATPSVAITKLFSKLSKVPGLDRIVSGGSKVMGKIGDVARSTPAIYKPIETFSPYFRRPEAGKIISKAEEVSTGRVNQVFEQIKNLSKGLTADQQVEVGRIIEGGSSTNKQLVAIAKQAQKMGAEVGQELINEGLLPKNAKLGQYLPHIFENAKQIIYNRPQGAIPKFVGSFFKKRTGKEGYLPEFAPSLFKGLGTEVKDIEVNKMFKELANQFGTKVTKKANVPDGYVWAKDVVTNPALKKLFKRTAIPQDIADYIARTFDNPKQSFFNKATNVWKAAKTIYNPAYHVRNLASNVIMSDMKTGRGFFKTAADTIGNLRANDWKKVATDAGLINRKTVGRGFDELKDDVARLGSDRGWGSKVHEKVQGFQQGSEELSKLTVFRATIEDLADKAGKTVQEAIADKSIISRAKDAAEEAIFSPYRISKAERGAVGSMIPFYSFARQALPFSAKTLAKNPERITKYQKTFDAVEGMSGEDKVPVEGRTKGYKQQVQLPGKDKEGKTRFFDPTYIVPWGNVGQDSQLPFGLSLNPFLTEIFQQSANRNFYFDQPITDSPIPRVQRKEKAESVGRMLEPTLLTNLRTKVAPAVAGKPDQYGRTRTVPQALLDTLFGIKTSNKNVDEMKESVAKTKAFDLRSFRNEEGKIMTDKTLSEAEKARQIIELRELYQKAR